MKWSTSQFFNILLEVQVPVNGSHCSNPLVSESEQTGSDVLFVSVCLEVSKELKVFDEDEGISRSFSPPGLCSVYSGLLYFSRYHIKTRTWTLQDFWANIDIREQKSSDISADVVIKYFSQKYVMAGHLTF